MTTRRRRKPWKPSKHTAITALGLINAAAMLMGSTAGLGLSDVAVRWVLFVGGIALVWRGMLEEEARQEALKTPPPPKEGE